MSSLFNFKKPGSIDPIKTYGLRQEDIDMLLYMVEEEKLAKDIYTAFGEKWLDPLFFYIAKSEHAHMSAVIRLLNQFNISYPTPSDEKGIFHNTTFTRLYNNFIENGSKSYLNALKDAVNLEQIDIDDLEKFIDDTSNHDIKVIFTYLVMSSYEHINLFMEKIQEHSALS